MGSSPLPTVETGGGHVTVSTVGGETGGIRARSSQTHGRFEARVQGDGRLALVTSGGGVIASIGVSGPGWQTLSIEWESSGIVTRRDSQVVQTINQTGSTSALSAALITGGTGTGGAAMAADWLAGDRLASCGASGPS